MKLTPRQITFLRKLLDLYQERRGPIHYSLLAQQLGVNKFSAYDMLKLLEHKGMAASEYSLARQTPGPGRSVILFRPTGKASELLRSFTSETLPIEEWQQTKEEILSRLREGKENYQDFLNELLAKIPEAKSPLIYCTQMITALVLTLSDVQERVAGLPPVKSILASAESAKLQLGTLAGLSWGSSLAGRTESSLVENLLSHTKRYQTYLSNLSEESLARLADFMGEALAASGLSH